MASPALASSAGGCARTRSTTWKSTQATALTYFLNSVDVGETVKAGVTLTDDPDGEESLTNPSKEAVDF